jgi:hypothetical protein
MRSRSRVDNNTRRVQHDCDGSSSGGRRRRVGCAFLWGAGGVLHHSGGHQPQHPHAAVRYRTHRPTTRLHPLGTRDLVQGARLQSPPRVHFAAQTFVVRYNLETARAHHQSSFVARAIPSRGNYSTATDSINHVAVCNAHSICRAEVQCSARIVM